MRKENVIINNFQVMMNIRETEGCMVLEHWHDPWEMLYIEEGEATQICDTGVMLFTKGDIILIAPKTIHSTLAGRGGCKIIVVQFSPQLWQGATERGYSAASNPYNSELGQLFKLLFREFTAKDEGFLNMTLGALLQIFAYLTRLEAVSIHKKPDYFKAKFIFDYIDSHISQNLTLEKAAQDLGYTPQYLTVLIKEYSGYSFKPYFDYIKVMSAVRLLKFDGITVSAAAERLGYTDLTSFSRTFKRVIGMSPRACRLLFDEKNLKN